MKISRKSWHYRFMEWTGGRPIYKDTLCQYMRGLLWAFIKLAAAIAGALLYAAAALYTLDQLLHGIQKDGAFPLTVVLTFAPILIGIFVCICQYDNWKRERYINKFGAEAYWAREEDLVRRKRSKSYLRKTEQVQKMMEHLKIFSVWISDRHKKVCRYIEFN